MQMLLQPNLKVAAATSIPLAFACRWWVERRAWRWHAALLRLCNLLVCVLQAAWLLPHGMLATSSMFFSLTPKGRYGLVYYVVKGALFHWVRRSGIQAEALSRGWLSRVCC